MDLKLPMSKVFIGPTNIIIDGMGLCRYDEHVKAWKWRRFVLEIYGVVL